MADTCLIDFAVTHVMTSLWSCSQPQTESARARSIGFHVLARFEVIAKVSSLANPKAPQQKSRPSQPLWGFTAFSWKIMDFFERRFWIAMPSQMNLGLDSKNPRFLTCFKCCGDDFHASYITGAFHKFLSSNTSFLSDQTMHKRWALQDSFLTFKENLESSNKVFSITSIRPLSPKKQEIVSNQNLRLEVPTDGASSSPLSSTPVELFRHLPFFIHIDLHFSYISDYLGTDSTLISKRKRSRWKVMKCVAKCFAKTKLGSFQCK